MDDRTEYYGEDAFEPDTDEPAGSWARLIRKLAELTDEIAKLAAKVPQEKQYVTVVLDHPGQYGGRQMLRTQLGQTHRVTFPEVRRPDGFLEAPETTVYVRVDL